MRIGMIVPPELRARPRAEGPRLLERLVAQLQEAGHDVLVAPSRDDAGAVPAGRSDPESTANDRPIDLYVRLVCDADGNVTAGRVTSVRSEDRDDGLDDESALAFAALRV